MPWAYERFKPFREKLEEAASEWFKSHGFPTHSERKFSLPKQLDWERNIIDGEVCRYIARKATKLHKDVHHGLSSQALAFNLLGPFLVRDDLATLGQLLHGEDWITTARLELEFEYEDREVFNEGTQQPTSLDARLSGGSTDLYIEVKLQEKEFGGCSTVENGNCEGMNPWKQFETCYLHQSAARTYWNQLERFGFLNGPFFDGPICPLARYYQFFREVLFALAKDGVFVLLVDARNPAFRRNGPTERGLFPFLLNSVPTEHQPRVRCVTIQSVIAGIRTSEIHADWIPEFQSKYGL